MVDEFDDLIIDGKKNKNSDILSEEDPLGLTAGFGRRRKSPDKVTTTKQGRRKPQTIVGSAPEINKIEEDGKFAKTSPFFFTTKKDDDLPGFLESDNRKEEIKETILDEENNENIPNFLKESKREEYKEGNEIKVKDKIPGFLEESRNFMKRKEKRIYNFR